MGVVPPVGHPAAVHSSAQQLGRRAKRRTTGLRTVFDFYCFELATALRSKLPLRAFRLILIVSSLAGIAFLFSSSMVGFTLVRALAEEQPGSVNAIAAMFCVANVYLGGSYVFREAFSARRFAVAGSPNLQFFRALDIRAVHVLVIYCGLRTAVFYLALLAVNFSFVLVFWSSLSLTMFGAAGVLVVPLSMCIITVAVAAKGAARRTPPEPIRRTAMVLIASACLVLGYATARFLAGPIRAAGLAESFSHDRAQMLVMSVGAVATVLGAAFAVRLARHVQQVVRDSFVIQESRPVVVRSSRVRGVLRWLDQVLPLPVILHRELARSWAYTLLRKTFTVLFMTLLVGLGVFLSGSDLLPVGGLGRQVFTLCYAAVFMALLGMTEVILRVIGPAMFSAQFRFAWENGLSQWRIAGHAAGYYLAPVTIVAAGVTGLVGMVTGVFSWGPVSVGICVVSAALIADSLTVAPRNADGSNGTDVVGGLVSLMLAVPVIFALSLGSVVGDILAIAHSVCLLGGAIVCMARRIRTLPSKFAMSRPDTSEDGRSSPASR